MFVVFFWFVGRTCGRRRRKAEETAVKAMAAVPEKTPCSSCSDAIRDALIIVLKLTATANVRLNDLLFYF